MRQVVARRDRRGRESRRRSPEAGRRTVAHRDGRGAVQLDDRRRIGAQQHVVEADDLRPVGRGRASRASACTAAIAACSVYGPNRRDRQRPLDERAALRRSAPDSTAIDPARRAAPARRLPIVRARAPRVVQQHQRQQAHRLRLRQQLDEQPSQPDRFAATDRAASATSPDDAE